MQVTIIHRARRKREENEYAKQKNIAHLYLVILSANHLMELMRKQNQQIDPQKCELIDIDYEKLQYQM